MQNPDLLKKMLMAKKQGKPMEKKEEMEQEEMTEEGEEGMPEPTSEGFKYASEEVANMMKEMGGEEEEPAEFQEVELVVDGNPLSGNALVDFVMENEEKIRAMDKKQSKGNSKEQQKFFDIDSEDRE